MKKGIFLIAFGVLFSTKIFAAVLEAINFQQEGEVSELEMVFDENEVKAKKFSITKDKQIIIDIKNVSASERVMRAFDTSEFSGSVVFVKSYVNPDDPDDIRIAIQLRDNVRSVMKRGPKRIVLQMENRFGVFNQEEIYASKTLKEKVKEEEFELGRLLIPKSESVEDILDNLTLSGKKKYIGKKISFTVKEVAVVDLLKMIADSAGFNIILTDKINSLPPLTLALTNVSWDQALDTILNLGQLVAKKNGIILMVQTLDEATVDKRKEIEAKRIAKKEKPLVTKVFAISYADLKEISKLLEEYLTPGRGRIGLDNRTNSLIVKDTADVIERIRKIVQVLDTQTPQVLIEAKIVEVTESYLKEIGLQEGIRFGYDPIGVVGAGSPANVGADVGTGIDGGPGFSFNSAPVGGQSPRSLFGLSIARFGRLTNLNFSLQLMENESKGKVIASPKVVTQNKKTAKLEASDIQSFAEVQGTGDSAITTFKETEAKLSLEVTPQVTNEGAIALDIVFDHETFLDRPPGSQAPPEKQTRKVETSVLVDNGSTIVLGGLFTYSKTESHSGIPFLKDIPMIGWLFRSPYNPAIKKTEMVIFITPRIINQEEAGLQEGS